MTDQNHDQRCSANCTCTDCTCGSTCRCQPKAWPSSDAGRQAHASAWWPA